MLEYVAAASELAASRRAQYSACCGTACSPCLATCSRRCPRGLLWAGCALRRSGAALRHMKQAHLYLEYVALRSRFVWRRGLRRHQEFRVKSATETAGSRSAAQSLNASPELLEALSDIHAGRLYASSRETDSFLFDSHGQLQQRLRGFDFALYLSNRTERVVSDLVELPWQVWLCMLFLCSTALVVIQLVSRHAPLVLVGVGFAFPLLLALLLSRLRWMHEQLLNPTLLHRAQVKAVQVVLQTVRFSAADEGVSLTSTSASGSIAEVEGYIAMRLEQLRTRGRRSRSFLGRSFSMSGSALGMQVFQNRVGRGLMTHERNKPAYLRKQGTGGPGRHTNISAHLHFKHRQRAAAVKLDKQLALFPFGARGPAMMMTALRISVFGTAVYLGVYAIIMSSTTVELYGDWSIAVFAAACLPVVCSALLAAKVLPLFVVCTSVEHLKSPREVEHVLRATKVRQALRALRLLLAFLYQAQATQSVLKSETGNGTLSALQLPSAEKYLHGTLSVRSRGSSRAGELSKPLLGGGAASARQRDRSQVALIGQASLMGDSDSSDSDGSHDSLHTASNSQSHGGLLHVRTDAQLEAAFELRSSRVAQLQADQIAEGIRRRAQPLKRAVSAPFTLKSTDNVRAITGKLDTALLKALADPATSDNEVLLAASQHAPPASTAATSVNDGHEHTIVVGGASVNANQASRDDFAPRRRRRPLVHLRARVELSRHGADFHVPRHIGIAATQARERQDVYEAFGLLDLSANGSLGSADIRRCLAALGVHWGPKPEHAEAVRIALKYINVKYGKPSSCSAELDFLSFYAWARQVESNTACKTTLAELLMRELADGAQDSGHHVRDVQGSQLSATSFRRVLHALNLALSLDDVRVLFRDANPSGRPDVLSFKGLQSLLEKHL